MLSRLIRQLVPLMLPLLCVLALGADLAGRAATRLIEDAEARVVVRRWVEVDSAGIFPRVVLGLQLAALGICIIWCARKAWPAAWRGALSPTRDRAFRARLLFAVVVLLLAAGVCLSEGRSIAALGLAAPGSLPTRILMPLAAAPWRRLTEPVLLALLLAILATSATAYRSAAKGFASGALLLCVTVGVESLLLHPAIASFSSSPGAAYLHFALTEGVILVLWLAVVRDRALENTPCDDFASAARVGLACLAVLSVSGVALAILPRAPLLVGAHYYSWFPANWAHGYVAAKALPPLAPALGEYSSANTAVLRKQIGWAREAGIDYFIFDWWPERPKIGKRIRRHLAKGALNDFKFALQYETLDLKPKGPKVPGEDPNALFLTPERVWWLKKHWEHLALRYMSHPSYLRIGGRPVLYVYATRHTLGPVAEAIREARLHVEETTGERLFLVADEAFFNVLTSTPSGRIVMRDRLNIEWERIVAFDAMTSYNPYDATRLEHGGEEGAGAFIADVADAYRRYRRAAAAAGMNFVPGVLPGYNDRGVRLGENHYVIPRRLSDGRSFFSAALERLATPFINPFSPMIAITSWNEWNEGTQIEPAVGPLKTNEDVSGPGAFYTRDEYLEGYGCGHLEELSSWRRAFEELRRGP